VVDLGVAGACAFSDRAGMEAVEEAARQAGLGATRVSTTVVGYKLGSVTERLDRIDPAVADLNEILNAEAQKRRKAEAERRKAAAERREHRRERDTFGVPVSGLADED
jgi:hypothetical protein